MCVFRIYYSTHSYWRTITYRKQIIEILKTVFCQSMAILQRKFAQRTDLGDICIKKAGNQICKTFIILKAITDSYILLTFNLVVVQSTPKKKYLSYIFNYQISLKVLASVSFKNKTNSFRCF